MSRLNDVVRVERRFARSARIDADLGITGSLVGYLMQPSVRRALETMTDGLCDGRQAAFTWTGPFGGGKSCAALLVASLVAGSAKERAFSRDLAGSELVTRFRRAFPSTRKGWRVIALTGRRVDLRAELAAAAQATFGWSKADMAASVADDRYLFERIEAEAKAGDGLLLIVDELGKFLEYSIGQGGDVHLLQDLAERAARSNGKLVVIGLLHQSFEQYAGKLGKAAREEWAKVQGRYLNIPFVAQADEVACLISRAIEAKHRPSEARVLAEKTALAVKRRREVDAESLTSVLEAAWPLHPVTTLLLGPVSRQRFAQNERSVFGFLSSAEPHGFQAHLAATDADVGDAWFGPDKLWDYLIANFGSALTAGVDSARLSLALDAVDRAASRGELHAKLTKAAALIEFFRDGSGLAVGDDVLSICAPTVSKGNIEAAIAELVDRSILIRQPRLGGYAIFSGSDFDIEEAINNQRARLDPEALMDLPSRLRIGSVPAKRHYIETGALRTFDVVLQLGEELSGDPTSWAAVCADRLAHRKRKNNGLLVLLVPDGETFDADPQKSAKALAIALKRVGLVAAVAVARSALVLRDYAADLYAIDAIEAVHPQLEGDRVARRELASRRDTVAETVRRELFAAFATADWFLERSKLTGLKGAPLSTVASAVALNVFDQAPVVQSELLNRDRPSSNAMAALRALLHAMVKSGGNEDLGLTGYPPERGLYLTVVKPFGLHGYRPKKGWGFCDPADVGPGLSLGGAWKVASGAKSIRASDLFQSWRQPPIGMKLGVMPIFALSFLLARRSLIAVYVNGVFQAELDELFVDRLLQNPDEVEFRRVERVRKDIKFIQSLAALLGTQAENIEREALPVASRLYQRFRAIPQWSQRTQRLPELSRQIRDIVLKASDPEDLLFIDLPDALREARDPAGAVHAALNDCEAAYGSMLANLRSRLADQLGVDPNTFDGLAPRAAGAKGVTADLRVDAFAMRAGEFGSGAGDIEGLASLLVHKPPRTWSDREHDQALFELAKLSRSFREAEVLATVQGRTPTSRAISVVVGIDPREKPIVRAFDVTDQELASADLMADHLFARLKTGKLNATVELAALARLVERVSRQRTVADAA